MIMDVVHNHIGPGTEAVTAFGPYLTDRFETFWGAGVDFSQPGVREWAIQNALQWVDDYGIDGLRLDAVHSIRDDSPQHVLASSPSACTPGRRARSSSPRRASDDDRPTAEWGHDARWADGLHHALHALLTGEREGYYATYGSVEDVRGSSSAGRRSATSSARRTTTRSATAPSATVSRPSSSRRLVGRPLLG